MILQLSGQVIECLQESSLQDYEMTERKTWAVDARRTFHSNSPSVSAAWKAWGVWFSWSLFHDWLGSEEDRGSSLLCEGTEGFKRWHFRETKCMFEAMVFLNVIPAFEMCYGLKDVETAGMIISAASTRRSFRFLKEKNKSYLYWFL